MVPAETVGHNALEGDAGSQCHHQSQGNLWLVREARFFLAVRQAAFGGVRRHMQRIILLLSGPQGRDSDDAVIDRADQTQVLACNMGAGVATHAHANIINAKDTIGITCHIGMRPAASALVRKFSGSHPCG